MSSLKTWGCTGFDRKILKSKAGFQAVVWSCLNPPQTNLSADALSKLRAALAREEATLAPVLVHA